MPLRLFLLLALLSLVCSEHLQCRLCTPGEYCFQDERYLCPQHSTSVHGADNITHCVCFGGYYADANHACIACSEGFFCSNDLQSACPGNRTSTSLASSLSDCVCDKGFEGDDCTACLPGFYKDSIGALACSPCPLNTFQSSTGSVSCEACGENEEAALGSPQCTCKTGHERVDGVCMAVCEQHSTRNDATKICECDPGHFKHNNTCAHTCDPGTFKAAYGDEACSPCAEGQYQPLSAATTCLACMDHATSGEGSDSIADCQCLPEYHLVSGSCAICTEGHYKDWIGNEACYQCSAGTYRDATQDALFCRNCSEGSYQSLTGQSACLACQDDSVSDEGQERCFCNAGYSWSEISVNTYQCSACLKGSYKMFIDNTQCTSCLNIMITDSTASTQSSDCQVCYGYITTEADGKHCNSCPLNSQYSLGGTSVSTCRCLAGYAGSYDSGSDTLTCTACENGKYKASVNNNLCTSCPAGNIGIEGTVIRDELSSSCVACLANEYRSSLTECTACPVNSVSPAGSDDVSACVCAAGFEHDGSTCVACADGFVKALSGNHACTACAAGKYTVAETCVDCPAFSTSAEASSSIGSCQCMAGFTGADGTACTACAPGTYKVSVGSASCVECTPGTYQYDTPPFTTYACEQCPENTTSPSASFSISACQCRAGYLMSEDPSVLTCHPCPAGSYCTDKVTQLPCSTGATSPLASDHAHDCTCVPGFTGVNNSCSRCPVNYYCEGGQHVQQCRENSSTLTLAGATNATACVCNPGFYDKDSQCEICPVDSWCYHNAENDCPGNSSSLAQTSTVAKCFCDEYFTKDAAGHCHLCGSHLVCHASDMVTDGVVEQCVQHSSNQHQSCVCEDGYYCRDGSTNTSCSDLYQGSCSYCEIGSFCQGNLKTACSMNETSPAGSSTIAACTCKPGYYRSGSLCLLCEKDYFCVNEIKYECASYDPELITLQAGSHAREQCLCKDGFFRTDATDLCKSCPLDYYCVSESISNLPNVEKCIPNAYTLTRGTVDRSGCICDAGFVLSDDAGTAECLPCETGQRCGGGVVLDSMCGVNNRVANEDHSACLCLPGYQENADGLCEPCVSPYYKPIAGDFSCTLCPETARYFNTTFCVDCAENEERSADGLSCSCVTPLVRDDSGMCAQCPVDTYHDAGTCVACTAHSTTQGVTGATTSAACVCNPGYIENAGVCNACTSGTYEKNGACVSCGVGAVSPEASYSSTQCGCAADSCQSYLWNHTCFGECEPTLEACTECQLGFFKDFVSAVGNTDTCSRCHLHTFANETGLVACHACPDNSVTADLGSDSVDLCVCAKGSEKVDADSDCTHCEPGYAKNTIGNHECTPCSKGFYADVEESLTCQECSRFNNDTTVAEAATNETLCVCSQGFYLKDDTACIPCVDGAYKSDDGNHLCTLCGVDPIHSYSTHDDVGAATQSVCTSCPVNSGQDQSVITFASPMDDVTDCLCFPGFTYNNGCVQCEDYKFKLGYSNNACAYCADGYFFVGHAQACAQCSLQDDSDPSRHHVGHAFNSLLSQVSWGVDESDCTCDLGFIRSADTCVGCSPGTFRADHSILTCSDCALNTYQNQAGQTECVSCPTNSYTNVTGASIVSQCYCNAGYEMNTNTYECEQCAAGKFKGPGPESCSPCPSGTYSLQGASECTPCAASETSAEGSPAESHCVCKAGFGGASCSPCQPGFYAAEGTLEQPDQECLSCPANKTSPVQSTIEADCVCQPGFGLDPSSDSSAACEPCVDGQYSTGGQNEFCRVCGFGTVTEPSTEATSIDACQCDATSGFF